MQYCFNSNSSMQKYLTEKNICTSKENCTTCPWRYSTKKSEYRCKLVDEQKVNKTNKLTEEQANLVASNYKLIYYFLRKKNLSDDYWDILAIATCEAAINYNPDFEKSFGVFAWVYMETAMKIHYKDSNRQKRKPKSKSSSLDEIIYDGTKITRLNTIKTSYNLENEAITNVNIEKIAEKLSPVYKQVFELILEGYKQTEISEILKIEKYRISLCIKNIRENLTD